MKLLIKSKNRFFTGISNLLGALVLLLGGSPAYASNYKAVVNNLVRVSTGIGAAMVLFGFVTVGIAYSSHVSAEWARGKEKGAWKGALFVLGASAIMSLLNEVFI